MITGTDRALAYCSSLNRVRARLDLVSSIWERQKSLGLEPGLDYEVIAVNLRKVLEHIAFGSLTANRAAYEAAHKDLQKVWSAKRLLERLESLHPQFYPQALEPPIITGEGTTARRMHFEFRSTESLTRSDFVALYDKCSEVIHVENPFSGKTAIDFGRSPLEWVTLIRNLLTFHFFRLHGTADVWIGELKGPNGDAHVYLASPQ